MFRYCLTIEYNGERFSGWQYQPDRPSVQQALEEAIESFSGEKVKTQAAGRTDAGVHAKGQVVHFDLSKNWDSFRIGEALNYHLREHRIAIINSKAVDQDFEARFSAKMRHYEYIILNRRAPAVLDFGLVWHVPKLLDVEKMHQAAQILLGRHDFTTFRATECQAKSPIRTIDRIEVFQCEEYIKVQVSALSFLHHQVRSIVGSLKLVGAGKWSVNEFKNALEAKDRKRCGTQAPANGLYLIGVDY